MIIFKWLRACYDYTLSLAHKRHALTFLALVAFCECIFFPIPPDIMLIPMVMEKPKKAWKIAFLTTLFSTLGGITGYYIGVFGYQAIARPIIHFYHYEQAFQHITHLYLQYGSLIVILGALSPIPYKVITISSGFFHMSLWSFILISIIARGGRFFLVAGLLKRYGDPIRIQIDRHFNTLVIIFCLLLVGGFFAIKGLAT